MQPQDSWSGRARESARVGVRAPIQARMGFLPPALMRTLQARRLRAAIAHAQSNVPYYRETLRRLGLDPRDFVTAGDLARLPVIERDQLQRDPEYFVSTAQPLACHVRLQSGGSTGEPVTVFRDSRSVVEATIHAQRLRSVVSRAAGRWRLREVVVRPPESSAGAFAAAFRRAVLVSPALRSDRRPLSLLDPPSAHVPVLERLRPDAIFGYGSYLEALFVHLADIDHRGHVPAVVVYAADPLSPGARELIGSRFGVTVLSAYQSIESGQAAFECQWHRGLHVNADFCPVRIVDGEGRDRTEGEEGDVVVSDLTNRATMLLNYRLGDVAACLPGRCPCGRTLPMISFLAGRRVEWLKSAGGEPLHPQLVKMLLRTEPEVRRYQVVQTAPGGFELALVTAPGCDRAVLAARLSDRFADRLGPGTRATVTFVEDLPRLPGGKVAPIVALAG